MSMICEHIHLWHFSSAFMHFQVCRFESLQQEFKSVFQKVYLLKNRLIDSNPFLTNLNLFSNNQISFRRFESLYRGFEFVFQNTQGFKINLRDSNPSAYLCLKPFLFFKSIVFLQNPFFVPFPFPLQMGFIHDFCLTSFYIPQTSFHHGSKPNKSTKCQTRSLGKRKA